MSIRNVVFALPFALGIACSHSQSKSQDHTGAMWNERGENAEASADATAAQVTPTSASSDQLIAAGGGTAATQGSDPSSGGGSPSGSPSGGSMGSGASSGSSDAGGTSGAQGQMGSGGSSETMGSSPQQGSSSGSMSGSQGDTSAHASDVKISGKISKVAKDGVTITPKDGSPVMTLKVVPETTITMNGKPAKVSQLKAGMPVRASYSEAGTEEVAVTIDAGSKARQGHHASGQQGSTGSGSSSGSSGKGSSGGSNQ